MAEEPDRLSRLGCIIVSTSVAKVRLSRHLSVTYTGCRDTEPVLLVGMMTAGDHTVDTESDQEAAPAALTANFTHEELRDDRQARLRVGHSRRGDTRVTQSGTPPLQVGDTRSLEWAGGHVHCDLRRRTLRRRAAGPAHHPVVGDAAGDGACDGGVAARARD